jgi:hypothetical protein
MAMGCGERPSRGSSIGCSKMTALTLLSRFSTHDPNTANDQVSRALDRDLGDPNTANDSLRLTEICILALPA